MRAAEWQETTRRHVKSEELLLKTRGALEERCAQKGWLEDKQHRMEREVADILKKREKELAKGGKLAALQETVKELGLGREKIKTQLELKNSGIADEEERVKSLQEGMKEVRCYFICSSALAGNSLLTVPRFPTRSRRLAARDPSSPPRPPRPMPPLRPLLT